MRKKYVDEMIAKAVDGIAKAYISVKDLGKENGTFKVIASTEAVDRHGEIVKASGWELENYKKNPIMLFGHDYRNAASIVGKATDVYVENDQLIVEGVFASTEPAQMIRQLYDDGIIKTVSVGFIPRGRDEQNDNIITKAELLEVSFVPVPSNYEALSLDEKQLAKAFEMWIVTKEVVVEDDEEEEDDTEEKQVTNKEVLDAITSLTKEVSELKSDMQCVKTAIEGAMKVADAEDKLEKSTKSLKQIATTVTTVLAQIKLD